MLGNATEQGVKMGLGEQNNFDSNELIMNGVFGMSEVVLGPVGEYAGDKAKNSIKDSLENSFKSSRAEVRRAEKDLAKQIRENAPFDMSKSQSKEAAKKLVQEARAHDTNVLQGTIKVIGKGVEVSVSAVSTTISEETKDALPKPNQ